MAELVKAKATEKSSGTIWKRSGTKLKELLGAEVPERERIRRQLERYNTNWQLFADALSFHAALLGDGGEEEEQQLMDAYDEYVALHDRAITVIEVPTEQPEQVRLAELLSQEKAEIALVDSTIKQVGDQVEVMVEVELFVLNFIEHMNFLLKTG